MSTPDPIYYGEEKLVISIDIGSTNCSVAVGHFVPSHPPRLRTVNRYPSSPHGSAQTRMPAVILYDMNDRPRAFGFETGQGEVVQAAREQGWASIRRFKAQMIEDKAEAGANKVEGHSGGLMGFKMRASEGPENAPRRRHASISDAPTISSPLKRAPPPLSIQKSIASLRGVASSPGRAVSPFPAVETLAWSSPFRGASERGDGVKINKEWRSSSSTAKVKQKKQTVYVGPLLKVIYADLLAHLVACARAWFEEVESPQAFARLWPSCVFVLTHPADYGPSEVDLLRNAAELAKILPADFAPGRLVFVKEPVAAVHFFRRHTSPAQQGWMRPGAVVVLDSSESWTSISGYTILDNADNKFSLRPFHPPAKLPVGSTSISSAIELALTKRLAKSKFKAPEMLRRAMGEFERAKVNWSGPKVDLLLRLADSGTDNGRGIVDGVLNLTGFEIEEAFTSVVEQLAVRTLALSTRGSAKHILLCGGLSEHPFVQLRLCQIFHPLGIQTIIPDIPVHIAISEGALRFYVAETVLPRVTRFEIGVSSSVDWSENWERGSQRQVFTSVTGARYIQGKWAPFVGKGLELAGLKEPIVKPYTLKNVLSSQDPFFTVEIFAHDPESEPEAKGWMTNLLGIAYPNFFSLGTVSADLGSLIALEVAHGRVRGEEDKAWVQLQVRLLVYMGARGLEACVAWDEGGVQKRAGVVRIAEEYY